MTAAVCHVNLARGFRGGERQTELLDLYRIGFKPEMTLEEHHRYHSEEPIVDPIDVLLFKQLPELFLLLAVDGFHGDENVYRTILSIIQNRNSILSTYIK